MRYLLPLLLFVACDKPGEVDGPCLPNGTCSSPALECIYIGQNPGQGSECRPKTTHTPRECYHESDCFCVTCAKKCAPTGLAECLFSDTTTWGARQPAVCKCKQDLPQNPTENR